MVAATPTTYTGKDAEIWIASGSGDSLGTLTPDSTIGISDFTLTLDKGVVEQDLVGEIGNYRTAGSLSCEISLTHCKLDSNAAPFLMEAVINGTDVTISGNAGTYSLHFYMVSCATTGFDITIGDADTITEGSVDFVVRTPYQIADTTPSANMGKYISNA